MKTTIPVHILTGFLGAGKTTLLNHLIKDLQPQRIMVIENEVGRVNIDGALVVDGVGGVVELTAGCICCSLNDELIETLADIAAKKENFDRLFIETTGIADPGAVAQIFLDYPFIADEFELINIICLADARNLETNLLEAEEAQRQLSAADVILLHKTDLVGPADRQQQRIPLIRGFNPLATIYATSLSNFPPSADLLKDAVPEIGAQHQTQSVDKTHAFKHQGISTYCLTFNRDFDLPTLSRELIKLLHIHRHQVLRIKGILATQHNPVKLILQSVRDTYTLSDGTPWQNHEPRESKMVFIGRGVEKSSLERFFSHCLIKEQPPGK
jgi:G3E family GTPase